MRVDKLAEESNSAIAVPDVEFTGERIVPGKTAEALFREHEERYLFAGQYVSGKEVLDVACGTGVGTSYLHWAGARRVWGLDIDPAAVAFARARYKECEFAECDATDLRLPDNSVDIVVSYETIEHVKNQTKFLLECGRVLRPGGILICSTPNRAIARWGQKNPFHLHELSVGEFTELVGAMFTEVQLYAQRNKTYPLYVARKVLLNLLDKLRLNEPVKRFLRGKPAPVVPKTEFDGNSNYLDGEIVPYRAALLIQPTYVISVGRKPLRKCMF